MHFLHSRNVFGLPDRTTLRTGGVIADGYDEEERLVSRRVVPAAPMGNAGSGTPEWVGDTGANEIARRYRYTAADEIAAVDSANGGAVYEYDLRRRLRSRTTPNATETFAVDPAGNYFPTSPGSAARTYGAGNVLSTQGTTEYRRDARGFLVEKRERSDAGVAVTTYAWDYKDRLGTVGLPDGRNVRFAYDAYAPRVRKTVYARAVDGSEAPQSTTHYVWDLGSVRHAVTFNADGMSTTRTYLHEEATEASPLAHRSGNDPSWAYYVGDVNGTPEELVDGSGAVVGRLERDSFGKITRAEGTTTDSRFPGQFEDEETGLFYNRYRYYDPTMGQYLSPDPIGLEGDENLFAYGPNPIGWYDPMGWTTRPHHQFGD